MVEIHKISGEKVEATEAAGDPSVIAQLEWLLERAKKGEITAISGAVREPDGVSTFQRGVWRGGFFEMIGALAILQIDLSNGSRIDSHNPK